MPDRWKVVLDTNIIVSRFISPQGPAGHILKALKEKKFILVTSQAVNEEVMEVMNRPRIRDRYGLQGYFFDIAYILWEQSQLVLNPPEVEISKDPDDNKFLSVAQKSRAHYIVTNDIDDLLDLKEYKGTQIVSLFEFLKLLNP